jgi:hypothetical protein
MMLSGCTIKFVLEGADSYIIMPDGKILNGSLSEVEIMIIVAHTGNKLDPPATLEYEYEGLVMGGGVAEDIAAYICCELGGDDYEMATGEDRFTITGSMDVIDFWTGLGITSLMPSFAPVVGLDEIIGSLMQQAIVDGVVYVENHMMVDGSTIDIEIRGDLKSSTDKKVGTFQLWLDAINPV